MIIYPLILVQMSQILFQIRTSMHVVYNAEEAALAVVQLSLKVPGKRRPKMVELRGTADSFYSCADEDFAVFTCATPRRLTK